MAGLRTERVAVGDIEIELDHGGSGAPVLLWHGFLETRLCWRALARKLLVGHKVIAPDMRGYGGSSKPDEGYDGRTLYEDFRGLLRALDVRQPVHLIAHDMGAPPALLWAGERPEEVASLTYVEEPLLTREALAPLFAFNREAHRMGGLWWWGFGLAPHAAEHILPGRERHFLTWFYDHYTAKRDAIEPETVDAYLEGFAGPKGLAGAFGVYRAVFDTIEQTEALESVEVPVLAIGGEKSLGDRVGTMLRPLCPRLRSETAPGAGHFVPDEAPGFLADVFLDWAAGIDGQPTGR